MRAFLLLLALPLVLALWGCGGSPKAPQPDKDAKIHAALAELDTTDRPLAEAQKFCAVQTRNRLGSMGKPYKILVKGQAVFLCCDGCEKRARADEDKTLQTVEELKKAAAKPAS